MHLKLRSVIPQSVLGVILCTASIRAADGASALPMDRVSGNRSVSNFLTPDGRFDLDVIRASGYQGTLDLKGVDVRVDSRTGTPLASIASPQAPAEDPDDIYWSALGSGMDYGVYALVVFNGKLIAGGGFTISGGVNTNHIAAWDGASWSALGSGMDYQVLALTVYGGKLIAGGSFSTAGGVAANHMASWDGSTWSPLGSGMNYGVLALTVYDSSLIAGGAFTTAGGVGVNNVASWNGASWSPLGSG